MVMKKQRFSISTTQIILLSFVLLIAAGAALLCLPVSSASGVAAAPLDALFTATTSACVTGLVVVPTATAWSAFGQAVILALIQVGGLGVITVVSAVMISLQRKMGIGDRLLLQDAFNLNDLSGLRQFVQKVFKGTLLIEALGALLYMTVFVPEFGTRGIWISIFTAVSAFCNAGIDIIGQNSLCDYVTDPMINGVTCALIIFGGIGYVVWWDMIRVMKLPRKRRLQSLTLHSKIALSMSAVLILSGAVCFLMFEYSNPDTLGGHSLVEKAQMALFQSVTTRTAGFMTIPQENFTNASSLISLLLMFIGGSPVGTAGGIKTVTFAVIAASALAAIRNKEDVDLFQRRLTKEAVSKALAVTCMSFLIFFLSTLLLSLVTEASLLDVLYETGSATATVGLSRNLTGTLGSWGKAILIVTMYFGRIGPVSLAIALNRKDTDHKYIRNPVEDISVG